MEEARTAKDQYKQELMGKPNVVGVGVGYKVVAGQQTDVPCVIVFVKQKVAAESLSRTQLVPEKVAKVPTDVVESGEIFAHQSRTGKFRPAPGGVSIGHRQITAGTFGAVVRDRISGDRLILSNNHVLANSNSASPGDIILQPGSAPARRIDAALHRADHHAGASIDGHLQQLSSRGVADPLAVR